MEANPVGATLVVALSTYYLTCLGFLGDHEGRPYNLLFVVRKAGLAYMAYSLPSGFSLARPTRLG